ncbi:hypothetical protein LUZ61_000660 [Rhynchospora tenuis]|uniref:AAA+ ATPase domain-containing protein n=1 Tax=Rhynchospora tenuis TaxID=198213 RepID=A0AAD6EQ98_9POAL|nr:hypothetical protein LUZ61_000660 [Rhynchospora tenuis]
MEFLDKTVTSKSSNLESALHCIKNDMHNNIIGIGGKGGAGKTYLLKQINNELIKDPRFEVVVFITCSKGISEERIQKKIIGNLHLSNNISYIERQQTIYHFLKERSFVILLDDLWCCVDLKTIGIPNPMKAVGTCKRKVVLTTRLIKVFEQMKVKKRIEVDVLNWDDALCLFKKKVTEEIINSDPLIQKYAEDVVKELGGLPLALIIIGRAMHDKLDPREWEQAVKLLKQARLNDLQFSDENRSVFHVLKFSYDNLKTNTLRQCFLHCSLWPENYEIQKDDLVKFWMGLGLIDEPKIQEAYDVGYCYIKTLQTICLLEMCDGAIKMHDVIHDMALWIANNQGEDANKWIVQVGMKTRRPNNEIDVSGDTEILSLMKIHACKVSIFATCSSTKLSTLLLNKNYIEDSKTLQLELFPKLTFLDLSSNDLESFPIEICKLVHLRFLNLSNNIHLNSLLPEELGALTNLKYLFLQYTECTFPRKVLSNMKALRVLDLRYYSMVESLQTFLGLQEDLQCLPDFKALGFSFSNSSTHDFQEFSQKVSVPIRWLKLRNCDGKTLSFSSFFLGNSHLQSNLISIDISYMHDVKFVKFEGIKKNPNVCYLGELETLSFDDMFDMKEVIWKRLNPKDVFPKLQFLRFWNCIELTSISWVVDLPCIRELYVARCDNIKQLIRVHELKNSGVKVSPHLFPFLKTMSVEYNSKLKRISDPTITFPALEFLTVFHCKLKKLPFNSSNIPKKLKLISGDEEWWNNVEMEDGGNKSSLQPIFEKLW